MQSCRRTRRCPSYLQRSSGELELIWCLQDTTSAFRELHELTCVPLPPSGREAILEALEANPTIVILGETGSGKTTRKFLCSPARQSSLTLAAVQRSLNTSSTPPSPAPALASP